MFTAIEDQPLLLFTLFATIAGGGFVALFLSFLRGGYTKEEYRRIDIVSVVLPLLAIAALVCAFFHLGYPAHAFNVMYTFGRTSMANEILVFGIFLILAIIYWIIAICGGLKGGFRIVASGITAAAGIVTAVFIGLAYMVRTVPAWDTGWTIIQELGIEFFSGIIVGAFLLTIALKEPRAEHEPAAAAIKLINIIGAAALIVSTCCIYGLGALVPSAMVDAMANTADNVVFFVLGIGFTVIGMIMTWLMLRRTSHRGFGIAAVVCAFAGAYFCHWVFYAVQINIGL